MADNDDYLAALGRAERPLRSRPARTEPSESSASKETVLEAIRTVRAPGASTKRTSWWLAPLLLVLYLLVERRAGAGLIELALVAFVLLVHELGHWMAMTAFGYADARIFFVPFLGAVTTGKKHDAPGWQRCVVLLAGPGPGILLAFALSFFHSRFASAVGYFFVSINLFNMLPVAALDGGRFFETLIVGRWPSLEVPLSRWLAVALGVLAWRLSSPILGVLAFFAIAESTVRALAARCAVALRPRWPIVPSSLETSDDAYLEDIMNELRIALGSHFDRAKPAALAENIRRVHERLMVRAPRSNEAALALVAYAALVIAGGVAYFQVIARFG